VEALVVSLSKKLHHHHGANVHEPALKKTGTEKGHRLLCVTKKTT